MTDDSPSQPRRPRWARFSLASMLLLTTVVSLSISLALVYDKLARTERELKSLQPISPEEVARQFEAVSAVRGIKTKVDDVRYSPTENAFKVEFSWAEPAKQAVPSRDHAPNAGRQMWSTSVKLMPDGFGAYFGKITSGEFLKAIGSTNDSYYVTVQTPSPLKAN